MDRYEDDCERLGRWVASLSKTAAATRAEAESRGPAWEYHDLSLASAEAQEEQVARLREKLRRVLEANRRWSP